MWTNCTTWVDEGCVTSQRAMDKVQACLQKQTLAKYAHSYDVGEVWLEEGTRMFSLMNIVMTSMVAVILNKYYWSAIAMHSYNSIVSVQTVLPGLIK